MKRLFAGLRIVTLTLALFFGGHAALPAAQAAGAGGLATNFVGRFYFVSACT
jgi:hypothetical protein